MQIQSRTSDVHIWLGHIANEVDLFEKNEPNSAGAMLLLVSFLLRLMKSPSFTPKTFLALLFQKDKAKEKNKSKNRNLKPRIQSF